jgi:phosphatidylethanolamine N-methyltransferase
MASTALSEYIDLDQPTLYISLASVLFNPIFWNIAARAEYRSKVLTKLAGGNRLLGCYALAATIFTLGIIRDILYKQAIDDQPQHPLLLSDGVKLASIVLFVVGNVLVLSSMYALGITGTYLGDYFGILMDERVTGFPFNITDNPMYYGSTMTFLSVALWEGKPAGIFITAVVLAAYLVALRFEEPFTAMIYAQREKQGKKE